MIRVSVLYPNGEGKRFDFDYYDSKHREIVERTLTPVRFEIDKGVDGPYVAAGHLYYDDMETLGASMADNSEAMGDIPNFTDIEPQMQISEVL